MEIISDFIIRYRIFISIKLIEQIENSIFEKFPSPFLLQLTNWNVGMFERPSKVQKMRVSSSAVINVNIYYIYIICNLVCNNIYQYIVSMAKMWKRPKATPTIQLKRKVEEATSPRVFLSGLWGIILRDSGFFSHFMKIGRGWQGPILELFLSPRASRVKNCYI